MLSRVRSVRLLLIGLSLSATPGCSKSAPLSVSVSGMVTLDSRPLDGGFLYFKTIETGALERFDLPGDEFQGPGRATCRRTSSATPLP